MDAISLIESIKNLEEQIMSSIEQDDIDYANKLIAQRDAMILDLCQDKSIHDNAQLKPKIQELYDLMNMNLNHISKLKNEIKDKILVFKKGDKSRNAYTMVRRYRR